MNTTDDAELIFCGDAVFRYAFDDGRLIAASPEFWKMMGLASAPDDGGRPRLADVMGGAGIDGAMRDVLSQRGEVHGQEWHFKTRQGEDRWILCDAYLRWDPEAKSQTVKAIVRDITDLRRAERRVRESEAAFGAIEAQLPDVVLIVQDGRIVHASRACASVLGFPATEIEAVGAHFEDLFSPESITLIKSNVSKLSRGGMVSREEYVLIGKNGRRINALVALTTLIHRGAEAMAAIITDITERRKEERGLRESEDRFRQIFESGMLGMAIIGMDYRFLRVNTTLCQMLGYAEDELRASTLLDVMHPEDIAKEVRLAQQMFARKIPFFTTKSRYIRSNKETIWANLTASVIVDDDGLTLQGLLMVEDITETKNAEKSLRESEERYRRLIETMSEGLGVTNENGRFTYVNDRFCRMLRRSRQEIIGQPATLFLDRANQTVFLQELERQRRGEERPYELVWMQTESERIPTIVSPHMMRDERGRFGGSFAVITDITHRKKMEEETRASLREKELLLMEIHHRVKNNLQVISSLLKLQSSLIPDPRVREIFKGSHDRIRTMALIHEKLYQSKDLARIDFGAYLRSLASHLLSSFGALLAGVKVEVDVRNVYLNINTAIPCGLLVNELLSNALKHAFPQGRPGEVRIMLSADGDRFVLTVQDNGVGLPPELDVGRTESLGLQLVHTLVKQLNGSLRVERESGTAFVITFAEVKYRHPTGEAPVVPVAAMPSHS